KTTLHLLEKNNLAADVLVANAESLPFKDESFDVVYINCMLMHTDKSKVFAEIIRVLKKDGIFVMKEVLKYWIFSFPYRTFSPYSATKPHYIALSDVKKLNAEHREFYLFSALFISLFYIFKNKHRAHSIFSFFEPLDNLVFRYLPFTKNGAWVTVARMRK
ncbi:MAG TPA: methyltransferase domain-containing protein, partial [Candidatus Nanoarchaeia archaeon]|nr:methyltransferase domain-containing protein [Candidatus Nanoarchaeia archaeon]